MRKSASQRYFARVSKTHPAASPYLAELASRQPRRRRSSARFKFNGATYGVKLVRAGDLRHGSFRWADGNVYALKDGRYGHVVDFPSTELQAAAWKALSSTGRR